MVLIVGVEFCLNLNNFLGCSFLHGSISRQGLADFLSKHRALPTLCARLSLCPTDSKRQLLISRHSALGFLSRRLICPSFNCDCCAAAQRKAPFRCPLLPGGLFIREARCEARHGCVIAVLICFGPIMVLHPAKVTLLMFSNGMRLCCHKEAGSPPGFVKTPVARCPSAPLPHPASKLVEQSVLGGFFLLFFLQEAVNGGLNISFSAALYSV